MTQEPMQVPLFPLSAHVLPGGRLRLRIFESRYLRMVKEACATQPSGYIGMCMFNDAGSVDQNTHIHPIGTLVRVIDFETLPDGLLGITVEGVQCFKLIEVNTAADGLRVGSVEPQATWPSTLLLNDDIVLAEQLGKVYDSYPELEGSKCPQQMQQAEWVCMRWLELLPICASTKQELLQQTDCTKALRFLRQLIQESDQ